YSAANALKSAWLMLQEVRDKDKNLAINTCTKASIANALLDTVIQGLNPAKKQVYYVAHGRLLTMYRSYLGTKAVCMRVDKTLGDIYAEVVYKGDNLEYRIERGRRLIEKHSQKLENIDDANIVAAYAVAVDKEGNVKRSELMTLEQLKQSWKQSPVHPIDEKGNINEKSTHAKFTAEMAKRTVTARMAKHIIGTSDDSDLVIQSVRRTDDAHAEAEAQAEVDENANQEVIDIGNGSEPNHVTEGGPVISDKYQPADPLIDDEKAEIESEEAAATSGPGF
ncbi:MAG: RecT family recombinase, partial [Phycisphaerae bacterium]